MLNATLKLVTSISLIVVTAQVHGEPTHDCSNQYATTAALFALPGQLFKTGGVGSVSAPFLARLFLKEGVLREAVTDIGLAPLLRALVKEQGRFFLVGGLLYFAGRQVSKRRVFDEALISALKEIELGKIGASTRDLAMVVNHAVYYASANPSEQVPIKFRLPKDLREELARILDGRRMSVEEFASALSGLMEEGAICASWQDPVRWVERVVLKHAHRTPKFY